jgi:pimeloyl-ACP methyl ester carboxylesterase
VSRAPEQDVVLLHGIWHGPWVWENWIPMLAEHGYRCHPVGPAQSASRLRTWIDAARRAIDALPNRPVLIGHSLGGLVAQHLMADLHFPAAVLLAPVPGRYPPSTVFRSSVRQPAATAESLLRRDLYAYVRTPARTRRSLFTPETPERSVEDAHRRLVGASPHLILDMLVSKPRAVDRATPVLVLAGGEDVLFRPRAIRRFANRIGADTVTIDGSGHDISLDRYWEGAAQTTLRWLTLLDDACNATQRSTRAVLAQAPKSRSTRDLPSGRSRSPS